MPNLFLGSSQHGSARIPRNPLPIQPVPHPAFRLAGRTLRNSICQCLGIPPEPSPTCRYQSTVQALHPGGTAGQHDGKCIPHRHVWPTGATGLATVGNGHGRGPPSVLSTRRGPVAQARPAPVTGWNRHAELQEASNASKNGNIYELNTGCRKNQ